MESYNGSIGEKQQFSINGRLIILLLVMILPFIAFSILKAIDIYNNLEDSTRSENLRFAKVITYGVDDYIASAGESLALIASNVNVRTQNYEAINSWFKEMSPEYPYYADILFVDRNGYIKASMNYSLKGLERRMVNVRNLPFYRKGISSEGVAVGNFMYSQFTKKPVIYVTYPAYDLSGNKVGIVVVALDLTKTQNKLMQTSTLKNTVVSIVDARGVYIARSNGPDFWVGKNISNTKRFKNMLGRKEGSYSAISADKTERIFSYATTGATNWFVRVGIDRKYIHDQVKHQLLNHFAVFIPLLLIALFGWFWIGRDVRTLHKRMEYLSLVDPLTGLWNYRKLNQDLEAELSRGRRYKKSISFAMIDIDYFKTFNDRNGHQKGDDALKAVADTIISVVRDTDIVYRYGGEEICILLPETKTAGAIKVAERAREAVEDVEINGEIAQPKGTLTISIGVATYPDDAISKEALIKCADIALYQAKKKGRNKAVFFSEGYNSSPYMVK